MKQQQQQLLGLSFFFTVYVYMHGLCLQLGWTCLEGNLGKQSRQVAFMALLGFFVMYCICFGSSWLAIYFSFELWLGISGYPWPRPLVVIYEHSIVAVRRRNALR